MAKVIFIVPPLTGHINPTVAVGEALLKRGHEVWWVGHQSALQRSLPYPLHPQAHIWYMAEELAAEQIGLLHRGRDARGIGAFQFLWEGVLLPLAEASFSTIQSALQEIQPDLCVVDQQALAGALACRIAQIPWITSCTTSAGVVDALAALPQASEWLQNQLEATLKRLALPNYAQYSMNELSISPQGAMIFSSRELSRAAHRDTIFPNHYHFVGPALKVQRAEIPFPWERLDPHKPKIFMSLGTVNAERGARLYQVALEAFSDASYQLCLVAPSSLLPDYIPTHVITQERVPQLDILSKMDLVISHAGHNTTCESLAHGLPLIVLPIKDDQPIIAEQIRQIGAGIRLPFARVKAKQLRTAVDQIFGQPSFKRAAEQVRREFAALGDGGEGGAKLIEQCLSSTFP